MTEPAKVVDAASLEAESTKVVTVKGKAFRIRRISMVEIASIRARPARIVKRKEVEQADPEDNANNMLRVAQEVTAAGLVEPPVWTGKPEEKPDGHVLPSVLVPYAMERSGEIMDLSDPFPEAAQAASFRDRGGAGAGGRENSKGGWKVARRGAKAPAR